MYCWQLMGSTLKEYFLSLASVLGRPDFFAPHLATIFWTPLRYKIGEPEGKSPIHAFSVPAGGLKFRATP